MGQSNTQTAARETVDETMREDMSQISQLMKEIDQIESQTSKALESQIPNNVLPFTTSLTEAVTKTNQENYKIASNSNEVLSNLGMQIKGCAEIKLEFSQVGVVVNLTCTQEGLFIVTDQGAEFKIPFKK